MGKGEVREVPKSVTYYLNGSLKKPNTVELVNNNHGFNEINARTNKFVTIVRSTKRIH